ncbi:MAG: hypothetical protein IMF06_16035 [Proteobacteria bacterium]|nr:hypothetical protein [Pseudomonadota bacterium]
MGSTLYWVALASIFAFGLFKGQYSGAEQMALASNDTVSSGQLDNQQAN